MKKRILLPTSFFFSVLFTVFLFGFMIGFISLVRLMSDINKDSNSKNHTNSEENEAIVTVNEVLDGDTISIKLDDNLKKKLGDRFKYLGKYNDKDNNNIVISVRIHGIDAPEDKEYSLEKKFYAPEAKDFVEKKINNKSIKINWEHSPKVLRRLLAYVYTQDDKGKYDDEKSLNELMIQEGYAWVYRRSKDPIRHPKEEEFKNLENKAKQAHKGVWNIEEEIKWKEKQGMTPSDKSNTYLIIDDVFHRELCNCKKVCDTKKNKSYQINYLQNREEIAKSYTACEYCNP